MEQTTTKTPLQVAIDFFGNQAKLADALGIKPQAISQWGDTIPRLRAFQIHALSGYKIPLDDLLSESDQEDDGK